MRRFTALFAALFLAAGLYAQNVIRADKNN